MLKDFDTRSAIALSLVVAMIVMAFVLAFRAPDSDIFKIVIGGLMTVGFASIIAFYFGSSSGSKAKDDAINQIAVAQVAPSAPAPSVVVSWWSLLTAPEQSAIEAAAPADSRIAAILTALKTGKAEAQDLDDLAAKGLLLRNRVDMLKGA